MNTHLHDLRHTLYITQPLQHETQYYCFFILNLVIFAFIPYFWILVFRIKLLNQKLLM